jgi:hypothetical protein
VGIAADVGPGLERTCALAATEPTAMPARVSDRSRSRNRPPARATQAGAAHAFAVRELAVHASPVGVSFVRVSSARISSVRVSPACVSSAIRTAVFPILARISSA